MRESFLFVIKVSIRPSDQDDRPNCQVLSRLPENREDAIEQCASQDITIESKKRM